MLEFQNISKRFGGVQALREVSFRVERATIHALVGENGAGKSTLMRIAAGIHLPDSGAMLLDDKPALIASPRRARALQIALVPQEPALCPNLSVEENLCLGEESQRLGVLNRRQMRARAVAALNRAQLKIAPDVLVENLAPAQKHLLQIARALAQDARVLILDEPTAALSEGEAHNLFERLRVLKTEGVTILYILHRLPEIFALCDAVTILRDGKHVVTQATSTLNSDEVVAHMVGRILAEEEREPLDADSLQSDDGDDRKVILKARKLTRAGVFEDVGFEIRAGEIVGMAGLVGSGRSEVARCIFGLDALTEGAMWLDGREYSPRSPQDAIRAGLALVPEDRRHHGLVMGLGVRENLSLPALASNRARLARFGIVNKAGECAAAKARVADLNIKTDGLEAGAETLSGGNQQKVVIGKWLTVAPRLLIVDEPTQGVDVGAKAQVHRLLRALAARGFGVLMISSDLPEVLHLSHRILVMREGRLAGELSRGATAEDVMRLAALGNLPQDFPMENSGEAKL